MVITRNQFDKAWLENLNAYQGKIDNFHIVEDEIFKAREQKVWYSCDNAASLNRFYKTIRPRNMAFEAKKYYQIVNTNSEQQKILYHYNISQVIPETMANLLFSKLPDIKITHGDIEDTVSEGLLADIMDDNDFGALLQTAAKYESYSGAVGFKITLDSDVSDMPIVQLYPKEDCEITRKYDRIIEIAFKDYYTVDKKNYTLYSVYGKGYIEYHLYKEDSEDEVPLKTVPECKDLKKVIFKDSSGKQLKKIMALYKENKAGGVSDYAPVMDSFQAIDQAYTGIMDLTAKGHIMEYLPESMLEKDVKTDSSIAPYTWDRNITILHDANYPDTEQKAERDVPDISNVLTAEKEHLNSLIMSTLINAGISPATVGFDVAGANSSALALSIRERVSIRTRDAKSVLWQNALKELVNLLFFYYNLSEGIEDDLIVTGEEFDVSVRFSEYESYERLSELVDVLSKTKDSGLIDLDTAMDILNQEFYNKNDTDLARMKLNIKEDMLLEDPVQKELESYESGEDEDEDD